MEEDDTTKLFLKDGIFNGMDNTIADALQHQNVKTLKRSSPSAMPLSILLTKWITPCMMHV